MQKQWGRREEGQTVVIIALAMVALVAFLSLAIDGGTAFALRRKMQNAADSASMAGADVLRNRFYADDLCDDAAQQVLAAIHTFAERNGVADTDGIPGNWVNANVTAYFARLEGTSLVNIEPSMDAWTDCIPSDARGVRVITRGSFRSFFAGLIGRDEFTAGAQASNLAFPTQGSLSSSLWSVFPVAVLQDDFEVGDTYYLFDTVDKEAPGSFGWWDLNGGTSGADQLSCWIMPSQPGCESLLTSVTIPMWGETSTGVTNSEKDEVISRWGDVVVIPIYDDTNGLPGDNLQYHFIGLGLFELTEYWFANNFHSPDPVSCYITGGQKCFSGVFVGWLLAPTLYD